MPPKKRGQAAGAKAGKRARTEPAAATATTTTSTTDGAPPAAAAGEDSAAAAAGKRYFLMKSEPETRMQDGQDMKFSIQDLAKLPARTADDGHQLEAQTDHWDGVRNYGARNVMKEMRVGDTAFFYHSNCKTPGIAGTVTIVREAYPDFTALDKKDPHYDPKSTKDEPRWYMVDVKLKEIFPKEISLKELQKHQDGKLKGMELLTQKRLSVSRVPEAAFNFIMGTLRKMPK